MANYNGNKPNRKIYARGKRNKIDLYITNYVDDVTLNWINSRAVVTSAIWELVKREAYREAAMYGQNLGASNGIQGVPDINQIIQTANSNQYNPNLKPEAIKGSMNSSANLSININDTRKPDDSFSVKESSEGQEISEAITDTIKTQSDNKNNILSSEDFKVVEEVAATEENKIIDTDISIQENKSLNKNDSDNKDKNKVRNNDNNEGLNLNAVFKKKKKVSTLQGKERTNFNSTKPNKIEMETLGLTEQHKK